MAWPTCSFCGLDRPGGVAGPAQVYICPACIRRAHSGEAVAPGEPEDPPEGA